MKSVDSQIYTTCISKVSAKLKSQVNEKVDHIVWRDVERPVANEIFEFSGKMFDILTDEIYHTNPT